MKTQEHENMKTEKWNYSVFMFSKLHIEWKHFHVEVTAQFIQHYPILWSIQNRTKQSVQYSHIYYVSSIPNIPQGYEMHRQTFLQQRNGEQNLRRRYMWSQNIGIDAEMPLGIEDGCWEG